MKKRNIFLVGLYSFITLHFYVLYWMHSTRKEMMARGAKDIPSIWWLVTPTIVAILLIPLLLFGPLLFQSSPSTDDTISTVAFLGILFIFIPLILALYGIWIWWLYKYSQAVELVTKKKIEFMLAFSLSVVFLFVGIMFIWPVIIQDGFNKVDENDALSPATPGPGLQSPAAASPSPVSPAASDSPQPPAPTTPSREA